MKLIINIVIIVLLCSCSLGADKKADSDEKEPFFGKNQIGNRLIGDWGIYVHIVNGVGSNCNVCPRIEFNESNRASLTLPSGDREEYKWSESVNNLNMEFVGDETLERYLPASEYELTFVQQEKFIELTLSLNENEQYILRK